MAVRLKRYIRGTLAAIAIAGLSATSAYGQVGDFLSTSKGKLDAFGGALDDGGGQDGLANFSGSFTIPLIDNFNIQVDGLIGGSGDTNWAVGGHLYWHDKDIGLVDINLSHLDFTNRGVTRIGLHGQYYVGPVTIKGNIGYQFINRGGRNSVFGGLSVDFFATPNLKLQVGGTGYRKQGIGFGRIEYLLPLNELIGGLPKSTPPLTVWMDGGAGNNRYWHVVAGVTLTFGCRGTLISLSRNCGGPNHLRRWITTLQPAVRNDGSTGTGTGRRAGGAAAPSDIRLKTDIVRIGTLANGIGLYHFRYVLGGKSFIGVMAQDVLTVRPDAVVQDKSGVLAVNYDALGLQLIALD